MHILDYMRGSLRYFQRFLESNIIARFGILEKILILDNLVIFNDVAYTQYNYAFLIFQSLCIKQLMRPLSLFFIQEMA